MSDRDPLQQLTDFTSGPVSPLPASEVRRLGDRRRARRTAVSAVAGATAVLAVAVPAGLYATRGGDAAPLPPSGVVTTIPDDFPLDRGFTGRPGTVEGPTDGDLGITPVELCGEVGWASAPEDRLDTWLSGPEVSESRELVLFGSETSAASAVEQFREQIAGCTQETATDRGGSTTEVYTSVRPAPVTGDSTGWQRNDKDSAFQVGSVTRVGNAVLLVTTSAAVPEGRQQFTALHDAAAVDLTARMCVFTTDGCRPTSTSGIPEGFPLDRGAYDFGADGDRRGPAANVQVAQPTPCDTAPLEGREVTGRLGFANLGQEFEDHRQLLLYADEAAAASVLAGLQDAVAGCATEPDNGMTLTWQTKTSDVGHPSVTAAQGVQGAIGGTTFQITRVGRALLQVAWSGEGTHDPEELAAITRQITPEMCGWSSDGCDDGGTPTGDAVTGAKLEITADFPLAEGFPSQSEMGADGYAGPNRTIDPVAIEVCGSPLPDHSHRDRLLARYESAEDYRTRQLTTYADADAAVAASRAFVAAFRDCPVDPEPDSEGYRSEREVQDLALGGESWALLDRAKKDGGETPFGFTVVVVRVGRSVLIEEQTGHAGYPSADGISDLGERLAAPLAAMCAFTAAGC